MLVAVRYFRGPWADPQCVCLLTATPPIPPPLPDAVISAHEHELGAPLIKSRRPVYYPRPWLSRPLSAWLEHMRSSPASGRRRGRRAWLPVPAYSYISLGSVVSSSSEMLGRSSRQTDARPSSFVETIAGLVAQFTATEALDRLVLCDLLGFGVLKTFRCLVAQFTVTEALDRLVLCDLLGFGGLKTFRCLVALFHAVGAHVAGFARVTFPANRTDLLAQAAWLLRMSLQSILWKQHPAVRQM
ncbi:uncharacterized protein LY79DRAFT_192300 [Colletotrichum navitas]|uniref:Uncharacterized protein n=1 Tax=Colletotrichum navitas TaxID=681940 RepID=A0AAD8PZG0_9PEZI|nr:uncharacterized protein LY79DRAFT_192300 [Colletotrichum navitas]KAK1590811.1 hypothetical protein LY79DRAFT_192300 [Colletotrichum navitas]